MKPLQFFLLVLFFCHNFLLCAQSDSTLLKGRFTTSLFGFIESQNTSAGGINFSGSTNGYIIGTKSGVFVADNWALGLSLTLDRTETKNDVFIYNEEQVTLGFWTRWFFFHKKSVGLFADLNPYIVSVDRRLDALDTNANLISIEGLGFGFAPGVGFAYFLNRNISFSLHLDYFYSFVYATRKESIIQSSINDQLEVNKLRFSFGFQIYLDEFFF